MKYRVLIPTSAAPQMIEAFEAHDAFEVDAPGPLSPEELVSAIPGAHAVIIRSNNQVTAEVLERADALRVVGRAGTGVDNVDVETATRRGVAVFNTPGANANATAEHTVALLFAMSRHVAAADASLRAGQWDRARFKGRELRGRTLGLLGVGRVGFLVAEKARALGMTVLACDPYRTAVADDPFDTVAFDDVVTRADVLSVHAPLTEETRSMVNADVLQRLPAGAQVINCARGGLIDEAALVAALESGHLSGAGLDVFENEPPHDHRLLELPQVVVTPHLGGSTREAQEQVGTQIASQVVAFLLHGDTTFCINPQALQST